MAFKLKGYSPFTKLDPPEKQKKIKSFIKNNMNKMTDSKLASKIHDMSDGKTEYTWNPKTGKVNSYSKTKKGKPYNIKKPK